MSSSVISNSVAEEVVPFLADGLFCDRPPGAFLFGLAVSEVVDCDAWDVDWPELGRLRVCMIRNKILESG